MTKSSPLSAIGNENDERTLDKLMNGTNVTMDDAQMWLTTLKYDDDSDEDDSPNALPTIHVDLASIRADGCPVAGIRLWNYNKSVEVSGNLYG